VAGRDSGKKGLRWPALDGVRAIAVMAVMCFHVAYPHFINGGYVGVDVFFVLSGFLITWLLVSEHDRLGGIGFGKFYARRALRLFPALAVVIVTVVVLVLADSGLAVWRHETLVGIPYVVLYTGNWAIAFGSALTLGLLSITWTLAIEEQFYLLWPLCLRTLLGRMHRRRIAAFLVVVALVEEVARIFIGLAGHPALSAWADKSTLTHSDGLMLGSAVALMWTCRNEWKAWPSIEKRAGTLGVVAVVVLAVVIAFGKPTTYEGTFLWITLAVYGSAALIIALVARPTGTLSRVLEVQPLQWIGTRSYGCYLWHFPIFAVVLTLNLPQSHLHFVRFAIVFAGTFVVAGLSYRFIEQPFLRRKARFSRVPVEASPAG
jgi:peptidoglycan/LPS O-acetylase OafA/YrhL